MNFLIFFIPFFFVLFKLYNQSLLGYIFDVNLVICNKRKIIQTDSISFVNGILYNIYLALHFFTVGYIKIYNNRLCAQFSVNNFSF